MQKTIKLTPYPCILIIKIVKYLPENVGGLVENNEGYIIMKLKLDDWESYYIHESCHVVQSVEKYIEQQLGEEEEAYLLQYITENVKKYVISKRINKNGRKRKNKTTKNLQQKCRSTSSLQEIYKRRSRKNN